ncbi:Ig-like domain-containing protein [Microbacterium sp. CPCC 204701]|uniref:Ig-like domain-containing protein n=1 Tax=Microbacterium sp. CPCC 204701 TaxID=2493084 RepID=UPI0013E32093|nr:Ig-like domain-containing protein [Microbacterium sp. CPCC 204701]
MTPRTQRRRTLVGALAAALTLVGGALTAAPAVALAPGLDPDDRLGDLVLDRTEGEITPAGGPQRLTTETGCPEGYRGSSRVLFVWSDGSWPMRVSASNLGLPALVATEAWAGSGLDGASIDRDNSVRPRSASTWGVGTLPKSHFVGHSGVATYLVACDPGAEPTGTFPSASDGVGDSKYFSIDVDIVWDDASNTGTWSVADEVEKAPTTTTVASSGITPTSATLTASIDPAAAGGTVTFKNGTATVGTVPVAGGTASLPVSGLSPNTDYTFTAEYSGDDTHEASVDDVALRTLPAIDDAETGIGVTVPEPGSAVPTGLSISVSPESVALAGGARAAGSPWMATGALGDTTVNDDRRDAAAKGWTLNGSVSPFTSGTNTIPASALAWTPAKVSGAGTAGPASTDLSADRPLATGVASAEANVLTTVDAALTLTVPADAAAGDYTSTLTLTLI